MTTTSPSTSSVNANTSAADVIGAPDPVTPSESQQGNNKPLSHLFDTSEADAILGGGGLDIVDQQEAVPSTENQEQAPVLTAEQVETLRQQLAVQQVSEQTQETQETLQFSQEFTTANDKFKELAGMDFGTAIDAYMEAKVGMNLQKTIETVNGMSQYINKRQGLDQVDQSRAALKQEWGGNFDTYLSLAQQEYSKLPDGNFKKSLDNSEGAKLLLAKALQTQGIQDVRTPVTASALNFGTSPQQNVTVGSQPTLRLSEILKMPTDKYNSPEIQQAIASGLYIRDIQ